MPRRIRFIVLMVAVGSTGLAGCGGDAARSAQATRASTGSAAVDQNKNSGQASPPTRPAYPRKEFTREAFLSTYHNPEEGISFRYPRNYSLEEGDVQESSFFLKRQGDLDSEQPGATLLATVLIPEDGYPNTTFEHGSLQLVANETATEKDCRESALLGAYGASPRTMTVQGITFRWSGRKSETAGTTILERAYAGYSQATCYEFLLTVAAEAAPDPDGFRKPADTNRIMKQLEKIVGSAQFFPKSAAPPAESDEEAGKPLVITTSGGRATYCQPNGPLQEMTAPEEPNTLVKSRNCRRRFVRT
jgi:outer membrane murein-binding lipoprotein Lpp